MKKLVLAAVAGVVVAGGAWAADAPEITRYTLDNGLEVVLVPDRRVPKVVTNLAFRVGGMNEPPGRGGFAHLFEHLMFSGTEAWPHFDDSTSAIGVTNNAWTWEDKTVYYMEGLSSTLPAIMSIDADRLANLGRAVEQRDLDVQRAVVKNEMRQNIIDSPAATGWEVFWSALYPDGHPYSHSVIGSIADLDAATLDDVRGFFNTYYVPNNAVYVVVGDIDVEATKAMVADTFGRVSRGADVPRTPVIATEPTKVRIELEDRVPNPLVGIAFSGPAFTAKENGALSIIAEILGNSEYGLLRERLVGSGLATYASSGWYRGYLGGRFIVEAAASDGVEAAQIETALREGLADFLSKPVDPEDVARAKRTLLLAARVAREPLSDLTQAVAEATDMLGDPALAFADDPQIAGATPGEIDAVARRLLAPDTSSTLVVRPGTRGGYPPLLADSTGDGAPFTAAPRPAVELPKLAPGTPKEATPPAMETATLSNGIEVIHYRTPEAPIAYVAARATGGWLNAPAGKEGLLSLASSMAWRGAGDRDLATFAKAAKDIGANIDSSSDQLATFVTLSAPPEQFDQGVTFLADAVLRPRFDPAEWTILINETVDSLARREADLPGVADRATRKVLFPQAPGKASTDWTIEGVQSIGMDEAKAAYARLYSPATTTFLSVGPMPVAEVAESLEKAFGSWADSEPGYAAEQWAAAQLPPTRKVLLLPEPGASQSAILVTRALPGRDEPLLTESLAVMRLLGDDFTSRLNSVIREEKGYSYGVYGSAYERIRKGSAMTIQTSVQADSTGPALAEYFTGFESLVSRPVAQEELDRTVTGFQLSLAGMAETSAGLFQTLVRMKGADLTLEGEVDIMRAMTRLTLAPVRDHAVKLSSLDEALIVVAGDPEVVLPQLAAIGITDVELVERKVATAAERGLDLGDESPPIAQPMGGASGGTRGVRNCTGAACPNDY